jgi:hypothetical protein
MTRHRSAPLIVATVLCLASAVAWAELPFKRTEERQPCSHFNKDRQPFFGDLHVHTSFSFDSYLSSQRNDPGAAYRYAMGEPIVVSDAAQIRPQQHRYSVHWTSLQSPITLNSWGQSTFVHKILPGSPTGFQPVSAPAASGLGFSYWRQITG